jgi:hypothetical protein
MVLYFPVSALVTLFGNILQNPLEPRARSDTKLMNVVVTFLSALGDEAETGGVHRMLGVCSEFERIAKVVVENAEKDHASRRKRKNQDQSSSSKPTTNSNNNNSSGSGNNNSNTTTTGQSPSFNPNPVPPSSRPTTANSATPQPTPSHNANSNNTHLTPPANDHRSPPNANNGYSPMVGTRSQASSPGLAPSTGWAGNNDFTPDSNSDYYGDMTAFMNSGLTSPPLPGSGLGGPGGYFQQPMLPQDLFSLPMTLDWDWAEMSGGAYPSVENGNYGSLVDNPGGNGRQGPPSRER